MQRMTLDATTIADLLVRVGRLAYSDTSPPALTPTQWTALRYFSQANRWSRTVSAFADYQGATRGTVSQTLKTLVAKGYLRRTRSREDGRSARLDLTEQGRAAVKSAPLERLMRHVAELPPATRENLGASLQELAAGMALDLRRPGFGVCRQCRFLQADSRIDASQPGAGCACLDTRLQPAELTELCANFRPM